MDPFTLINTLIVIGILLVAAQTSTHYMGLLIAPLAVGTVLLLLHHLSLRLYQKHYKVLAWFGGGVSYLAGSLTLLAVLGQAMLHHSVQSLGYSVVMGVIWYAVVGSSFLCTMISDRGIYLRRGFVICTSIFFLLWSGDHFFDLYLRYGLVFHNVLLATLALSLLAGANTILIACAEKD